MYLFWDVPWLWGREEACGRIIWFSLAYCTLGEPPLEKNQRIQSRRGHFFFFLRRPVIWEEDVWEYKVTPNLSRGVAWRTVTHLRISKKKLGCVEMLSPSSVQFSCSVMSDSLWPYGLQHASPPCPSPAAGVYSNSCPLGWWCHPTISSSVINLSSCLQSFPASESFPVSQFFASGDKSFGVSASASVPPMNIQDWFHLGLTGWISLQFKGLSRVFSNTTVQKHQFFGAQLSL